MSQAPEDNFDAAYAAVRAKLDAVRDPRILNLYSTQNHGYGKLYVAATVDYECDQETARAVVEVIAAVVRPTWPTRAGGYSWQIDAQSEGLLLACAFGGWLNHHET
ncbi:MAG: hypothetical protein IPK81_19585 [Rhodospirillales bacterium]|nr:MAG: hypothetical protein IPK81_19585 [Rhodospirillales bacterium]